VPFIIFGVLGTYEIENIFGVLGTQALKFPLGVLGTFRWVF
jgi:hypothetical protein